MIRTSVILVLALTAAIIQAQNPATAPKPRSASPGTSAATKKPPVAGAAQTTPGSSEAAITIEGLCSAPARRATAAPANPASCSTVITKKQFEELLNTVNPTHQPIPAAQRQQVAQRYVDLLVMADAARKAGIENKPQFQDALRVQRMALLQQVYLQDLEEQYKTPPQDEIEKFYKDNVSKFEEVKVHRFFIPKTNPSGQGNKEEYDKKAPDVASEMRERAAKGEDIDKLQKEAYEKLGITNPPPSTDFGKRKRGMFPPQEDQDIFALKAGEVTKVEAGNSGWVVYKVDTKETIPLDQVREEISRNLSQQKLRSKTDSIKASIHADFNKDYFAPPAPPVPPPSVHPAPPNSLPQAPNPKPGGPPPADSATPSTPPAPSSSAQPTKPATPPSTPPPQ